jgi:hypothetical protein
LRIDLIQVKSMPGLHRLNGNSRIAGLQPHAAKTICHEAICFGADQFSIGGSCPEIDSARLKELAAEMTEEPNDLRRIDVLKRELSKI